VLSRPGLNRPAESHGLQQALACRGVRRSETQGKLECATNHCAHWTHCSPLRLPTGGRDRCSRADREPAAEETCCSRRICGQCSNPKREGACVCLRHTSAVACRTRRSRSHLAYLPNRDAATTVQSKSKVTSAGISDSAVFIADISGPSAASLAAALDGADALVIATSGIPQIRPLSILKVLWAKVTKQEGVRPEFDWKDGQWPEQVLAPTPSTAGCLPAASCCVCGFDPGQR
jgi:hypothetical protein